MSMDAFKEFQGKTLNNAIEEACSYFNAPRHQLEIEILRDAKTGIFGIVGSRKAAIRARRVHLEEAVSSLLHGDSDEVPVQTPSEEGDKAEHSVVPVETKDEREPKEESERLPLSPSQHKGNKGKTPKPHPKKQSAAYGSKKAASHDLSLTEKEPEAVFEKQEDNAPPIEESPCAKRRPLPKKEQKVHGKTQKKRSVERRPVVPHNEPPIADASLEMHAQFEYDDMPDDIPDGLPLISEEELSSQSFKTFLEDTLSRLIRPIMGCDVRLETEVTHGRVRVHIDSGEDSGLLIGREGQTLCAIQYLTSRIITHAKNGAVRLQLDAGEYRHRQEEKLHDIALALADRARQTGHSYSTRPLSSYHRRLVHLALQNEHDIQTRSIGPGSMKRVIIMRKRGDKTSDTPPDDLDS